PDELNAVRIEGGRINSNTEYGIRIACGSNKPIQGLYLTDCVQFEANELAGIRLQSGRINGFFLTDVYGELTDTNQRFFEALGDGTNSYFCSVLKIDGL